MNKCPHCGFSPNIIPSELNNYIQENIKHIEMKYEEKILCLESEIVNLKIENDKLRLYKFLNYSMKEG